MNLKTIGKRTFRRESDWKSLIEEWMQSGTSIEAFCQNKKIAQSGFYTWRKRLYPNVADKKIKPKSASNLFVPVALHPSDIVSLPLNKVTLTYPNGCHLQILGPFDANVLKIVNQAMGVSVC